MKIIQGIIQKNLEISFKNIFFFFFFYIFLKKIKYFHKNNILITIFYQN